MECPDESCNYECQLKEIGEYLEMQKNFNSIRNLCIGVLYKLELDEERNNFDFAYQDMSDNGERKEIDEFSIFVFP